MEEKVDIGNAVLSISNNFVNLVDLYRFGQSCQLCEFLVGLNDFVDFCRFYTVIAVDTLFLTL